MKTRIAHILCMVTAFAFVAEAQAGSFRHPTRDEVTTGTVIYRAEGKEVRPQGQVTAVRDGMVFWRQPSPSGSAKEELTPIGDVLQSYYIQAEETKAR